MYYSLQEVELGKTIIRQGGKVLMVNHDILDLDSAWYKWQIEGKYIQDAFSFLTAGEREFIQSGLLPEEFDELTKDE
jgi:hypothetical protein